MAIAATATGCGGGASDSSGLEVSVTPATAQATTSTTLQFSAAVRNSSNSSVIWSVAGMPGGNPTVGTIDANGLYTAPDVAPAPNTVSVSAGSVLAPLQTGSSSVTISNAAPSLSTVSPGEAVQGAADAQITVVGANFTSQSTVNVKGVPLATTFTNPQELTAILPTAQLAKAGDLPLTVSTPAPVGEHRIFASNRAGAD